MKKRGWEYEEARRDEQTRQNLAEQRKQNMGVAGCFVVFGVLMLGSFVCLTSGFALALMPALFPAWPVWACFVVGAFVSVAVMGLLLWVGGDFGDKTVRVVVVAVMVGVLAPIFARARENAIKEHQKALRLQKVQPSGSGEP